MGRNFLEQAVFRQHLAILTWVFSDEAATACQQVWSGTADSSDQGSHDLRQGLSLGQTSADEQGKAPQCLRLRSSSPICWATFKLHLELALKLVKKERVVLGGTQ